jgi:hypothetical protein
MLKQVVYVEQLGFKGLIFATWKTFQVELKMADHSGRSNAGTVGSNPSRGMDVCVWVYSVFMLSYVYVAALRLADPPSKESYHLWRKDCDTEIEARAQRRAVEPSMNEWRIENEDIGIEIEFRTKHLHNTSLEHYRYTSLLGYFSFIWPP